MFSYFAWLIFNIFAKNIGNIISVGSPANDDGDMVYFGTPTPLLLGQVQEVNVNKPAGVNQIVVKWLK